MKLFRLFVILYGLCIGANSQVLDRETEKVAITKDTIFIDEDQINIDNIIFYKKLNSTQYFANVYESDQNVFAQLQWTHYFGALSQSQKPQLFQLLHKSYHVDTTKVMVLHYLDTLKSASTYPKRDKIVEIDEKRHKHVITYKTFLKQHKNCIRKFRKNKEAEVYHLYSVNGGHPDQVKNMLWYRDFQNKIKLLFKKNFQTPYTIIIHPNGDYLIHYSFDGAYSIETLLNLENNRNWNFYKNDFINRNQVLNTNKFKD